MIWSAESGGVNITVCRCQFCGCLQSKVVAPSMAPSYSSARLLSTPVPLGLWTILVLSRARVYHSLLPRRIRTIPFNVCVVATPA